MSPIRPLVKYHGGKGRLHQFIIGHVPPHTTYVEPFGGAASVLLNKTPAPAEVYNELEPEMFHLMHTLQNHYESFYDGVVKFEYTKPTFLEQKRKYLAGNFPDGLERAVCCYAVKRMSRGGLGERFSWSDTRRYSTGPSEEHCWNTALANLPFVYRRLKNVQLYNNDAFDLLPNYLNDPDCFLYLDPPYLTSTRVYRKAYDFEFTLADHERLIQLVLKAPAKILLSGYDSPEYTTWLSGWGRSSKNVGNHASQYNGKVKVRKLETLWFNYDR